MKNQKGFAVLEGLLILVIVGILAGTGWYVVNAKRNADKALGSTTNYSAPKTTRTIKDSAPKTMTIKEWGVQATYSGDQTLQYDVVNQNGNSWAYVSSTELVAKGCSVDGGAAGAINRYKFDQQIPSPGGENSGTPVQLIASGALTEYAKVGDYYYYFEHGQAACSMNQDTINLQGDASAILRALVPNFKAVSQ